jgi:nitrogen fixation NifU-like protein
MYDLYQEIIIDHGRRPRNFGQIIAPDYAHEGFNPLCGDQMTVYLSVKHDVLQDAKFEGKGCAISMASASLMTEALKGKKIDEIAGLFQAFHQLVTLGKCENEELLGKLSALKGVHDYPMRVKCATLAWHTLNAALKHEKEIASSE